MLTVSGLIGITLHAPIGAIIDATHHKRGLIIAGTCALAASALAIAWAPTFPVVLSADILMAVAGAIFAPTVAAITLGMTPQQALPPRLGRNAAFDRAGNIFIAVLAGLVGWAFSQRAVFYLVPFFAVLTTLRPVLSIPAHAIDHDRARGLVHSSATDNENPGELAGASTNFAHYWSSRQQMRCSISPMHPCCPCSDRNWRLLIQAQRAHSSGPASSPPKSSQFPRLCWSDGRRIVGGASPFADWIWAAADSRRIVHGLR